MKRHHAILNCLAATFFAARADVAIDWSTIEPSIVQANGTTPAPAAWMAQLVSAGPDGQIAAYLPGTPYAVGGDDVVLHSQRLNDFPADGYLFGSESPFRFTGNTMVGQRVYTRVFNVNYGAVPNSGNPVVVPTLRGLSALSDPLVLLAITDPTTILQHAPAVMVNQGSTGPTPPGTVTIGSFPDASRRVSFNGGTGTQYYLETRTSLTSGAWSTAAGPVSGSGPLQLVIPANSPSPSYFRVRAE